tara:strand:+ start:290 stop:463 length:174 start_codon:yes stop_codon:yes gene_type:complete
MDISKEQLQELTEIVEDTVQYFCDTNQASGQLVWTCIETLSTAKLAELNGELAPTIS